MSGQDLEELLIDAIEAYNRYRGAEAQCRLEKVEDNEAIVRFEGSFCLTCGVIDWVEDLIYILKGLGVEAKISSVEYHVDEGYLVARIVFTSVT
ncbi:MAG: hypothetical protein QXH02_06070 [Desulfurococcaceae archaeon]